MYITNITLYNIYYNDIIVVSYNSCTYISEEFIERHIILCAVNMVYNCCISTCFIVDLDALLMDTTFSITIFIFANEFVRLHESWDHFWYVGFGRKRSARVFN